jgi:fatty acid elongase 3
MSTWAVSLDQPIDIMNDLISLQSDFVFANAPLSSYHAPVVTGAVYAISMMLMAWYMRAVRQGVGIDTKALQAVHNLMLCGISLLMFVAAVVEVAKRVVAENSCAYMFCESLDTKPNGALFFWSYVYYLSKYYELLDTVLQLLKGRPPPHFFLHVYHHAAVLVMAWAWLEYAQTLQYVGLLFNTGVHVVMYYYYFRRVMGWPVPWKSYVTKLQIVQFAFSLLCGVVTCYMVANGAQCAGLPALFANFCFNVTLLFQFVGVLGANNGKKGKAQ